MESVFSYCVQGNSLWRKFVQPRPTAILHSGSLTSNSETAFYLLTAHTLYHCISSDSGSECDKEAALDWTTLAPFEERSVAGIKYGFSLKAKGETVDFYTITAEELSIWVEFLEVYCVLTDIDDDYTLIRQIGVGGQAQVYLAESLSSEKRVAIKRYTKVYLMEQAKRLESLVCEIKILRKCSHPHIVQLYQVYEDEQVVSLVMEYIPGEELYKNFLHHGRFHSSEAKQFSANLLDLLEYLESVHIVHRDLKPENIMIPDHTNRADFKVIDFGFAMEYTGQAICDSCGSPGYIAPEVINERRHDASVDLYSAGVILYVALYGHSPFFAESRKEVLRLNAAGVIRYDVHRPEEKLAQLIISMTAFDPLQRGSIPHLRRLLAGCYLLQPIDSLPFTRSQ